MAGPLPNTKHERFVQALAKGQTLADAYVTAGYKPNEKNAARLKKNEGVAARLAELQERAAAKVEVTVADIARQLDQDREFARTKESPSAAVQATMGKAKVLGLIVERHRHGLDLSGATDEELEVLERLLSRSAPGA